MQGVIRSTLTEFKILGSALSKGLGKVVGNHEKVQEHYDQGYNSIHSYLEVGPAEHSGIYFWINMIGL